jgi:hypothetical protein
MFIFVKIFESILRPSPFKKRNRQREEKKICFAIERKTPKYDYVIWRNWPFKWPSTVQYRGGTRLVAELAVGAVGELPEAEGDLGADGEILLTQRLLHHLLEEDPPPPLVDPHLNQLYLL